MTNDEKRQMAVELMKSREKKNDYTNGGYRVYFFGKGGSEFGYSDCSSAVRACIEKAAGIDIGRNTDKQIRNLLAGKGKLVDAGSNGRIYPDESKLKAGDCIYFRGNKSHVRSVGHVEMYTGENECWGHGSGMGPNRHDLKKYCEGRAKDSDKRYLCTVRWIPDEDDIELEDIRTVQGTGWRVYKTLPTEPEVVGLVNTGVELRVFGEKDGYFAVKTPEGDMKGYIRKEAFEVGETEDG